MNISRTIITLASILLAKTAKAAPAQDAAHLASLACDPAQITSQVEAILTRDLPAIIEKALTDTEHFNVEDMARDAIHDKVSDGMSDIAIEDIVSDYVKGEISDRMIESAVEAAAESAMENANLDDAISDWAGNNLDSDEISQKAAEAWLDNHDSMVRVQMVVEHAADVLVERAENLGDDEQQAMIAQAEQALAFAMKGEL